MALANHPPTRIDIPERLVSARDGLRYPMDRFAMSDGALYFGRHGAGIPEIAYQERWVLPAQGWVAIRWTMRDGVAALGYDWYVDIDTVDVQDAHWTITDRYLDMTVREGVSYQVLDADELAEAAATGVIGMPQVISSLQALDRLCKSLRARDFSMREVLRDLVPGLPV